MMLVLVPHVFLVRCIAYDQHLRKTRLDVTRHEEQHQQQPVTTHAGLGKCCGKITSALVMPVLDTICSTNKYCFVDIKLCFNEALLRHCLVQGPCMHGKVYLPTDLQAVWSICLATALCSDTQHVAASLRRIAEASTHGISWTTLLRCWSSALSALILELYATL